jgi:hypothetical protein
MLRWARIGFHKKGAETHYVELVFLHPMGFAGRVVYFGVFGAQHVDELFFMLGMAWCGFHKNRAGTRYTELAYLHPVGTAGHIVHSSASVREMWSHYFSCSGGTGMYSKKVLHDTLCRTGVFAFGGICRSCCAFCCVWGAKC